MATQNPFDFVSEDCVHIILSYLDRVSLNAFRCNHFYNDTISNSPHGWEGAFKERWKGFSWRKEADETKEAEFVERIDYQASLLAREKLISYCFSDSISRMNARVAGVFAAEAMNLYQQLAFAENRQREREKFCFSACKIIDLYISKIGCHINEGILELYESPPFRRALWQVSELLTLLAFSSPNALTTQQSADSTWYECLHSLFTSQMQMNSGTQNESAIQKPAVLWSSLFHSFFSAYNPTSTESCLLSATIGCATGSLLCHQHEKTREKLRSLYTTSPQAELSRVWDAVVIPSPISSVIDHTPEAAMLPWQPKLISVNGETHVDIQAMSGNWAGLYWYLQYPGRRQLNWNVDRAMCVHFNFQLDGQVHAEGTDQVGSFTIDGNMEWTNPWSFTNDGLTLIRDHMEFLSQRSAEQNAVNPNVQFSTPEEENPDSLRAFLDLLQQLESSEAPTANVDDSLWQNWIRSADVEAQDNTPTNRRPTLFLRLVKRYISGPTWTYNGVWNPHLSVFGGIWGDSNWGGPFVFWKNA